MDKTGYVQNKNVLFSLVFIEIIYKKKIELVNLLIYFAILDYITKIERLLYNFGKNKIAVFLYTDI